MAIGAKQPEVLREIVVQVAIDMVDLKHQGRAVPLRAMATQLAGIGASEEAQRGFETSAVHSWRA